MERRLTVVDRAMTFDRWMMISGVPTRCGRRARSDADALQAERGGAARAISAAEDSAFWNRLCAEWEGRNRGI